MSSMYRMPQGKRGIVEFHNVCIVPISVFFFSLDGVYAFVQAPVMCSLFCQPFQHCHQE